MAKLWSDSPRVSVYQPKYEENILYKYLKSRNIKFKGYGEVENPSINTDIC